MSEYQGHASKGHWNVALWISNEYECYLFAKEGIKGAKAALFA